MRGKDKAKTPSCPRLPLLGAQLRILRGLLCFKWVLPLEAARFKSGGWGGTERHQELQQDPKCLKETCFTGCRDFS